MNEGKAKERDWRKHTHALKMHMKDHCILRPTTELGSGHFKFRWYQTSHDQPLLVLRGVYNLAIKVHHKLNFGFYAFSQGGIFLYTFIWFQIGLYRTHKHSETP